MSQNVSSIGEAHDTIFCQDRFINDNGVAKGLDYGTQIASETMPRGQRRAGWIDWRNSAAREILIEDLQPGGWLYEEDLKVSVIYSIYFHNLEEFEDVPFDQFEVRYKEAKKNATKRYARSAEEARYLEHDRQLYPRQSSNRRGEPVFDMDVAKGLLREEINLHPSMKPKALWQSRQEYMKFKLDIFRQRIYQEKRRKKYLNHLDKKRTKKRDAFAKKKAKEANQEE